MYNLYDKVELKDGTVAVIIEKFSDKDFLFEIADKDDFMKEGSVNDIKRKVA